MTKGFKFNSSWAGIILFLPLMFASCSSDKWNEQNAPKPLKEGVYTQPEEWSLSFVVDNISFELSNPSVSNWYKNGQLYHKVWKFSGEDIQITLSYKTVDGIESYTASGTGRFNGDSFILHNLSYDSVNFFTGYLKMNLCDKPVVFAAAVNLSR